QRLTLYVPALALYQSVLKLRVKLVRLTPAHCDNSIEAVKGIVIFASAQPNTKDLLIASRDRDPVVSRTLRSRLRWIHRIGTAMDHCFMKCVFVVCFSVRVSVQATRVRLVLCKQKLGLAIRIQPILAKVSSVNAD